MSFASVSDFFLSFFADAIAILPKPDGLFLCSFYFVCVYIYMLLQFLVWYGIPVLA